MNKALVLLSGGIDSSTCLYLAKKEYETYALTINYYYRWDKEIECTRKLAMASKTELLINLKMMMHDGLSTYQQRIYYFMQ